MTFPDPIFSLLIALVAALLSAGLIYLLRPLLLRYALARPNARSSHRLPTPQGAGIAVIAATLAVAGGCSAVVHPAIPPVVFAAALLISLVGAADDIRSIPVVPRLLLQAVAVGAVVFTAPTELRVIPLLPIGIERGLIFMTGIWFVNLVNFMDGLDWMTVAEVVPVAGAIVLLGLLGKLAPPATAAAAALCGAVLGFAPFNRPVAKVFLGDVGSLSIGLLLGWCLLQLAYEQHLAATLLLPLYYLSDATATLVRRMARREPFWTAHRSHFYQRATDNGLSVLRVVGEVFTLNVFLAALAIASSVVTSRFFTAILLSAGGIAVAFVMTRFSRK